MAGRAVMDVSAAEAARATLARRILRRVFMSIR
jgi:hypothetical protein